jgi:hypothetical protein
MGNDCRECLAGRPHCHGTLIRHSTSWQCTDPDCTHPELLLHSLSIDCAALGCPCVEHADHSMAV